MILPRAPLQYDVNNEEQTRSRIEAADRENLKRGRDIELGNGERIIMRSPNGSRFALAVDDSGVLSAVAL